MTHDENKPLILACDASPYGVGAVIFQYEPRWHRTKLLISPELFQNQREIMLKLIGKRWQLFSGLENFLSFLSEKKFLIITDHKLFISLSNPY